MIFCKELANAATAYSAKDNILILGLAFNEVEKITKPSILVVDSFAALETEDLQSGLVGNVIPDALRKSRTARSSWGPASTAAASGRAGWRATSGGSHGDVTITISSSRVAALRDTTSTGCRGAGRRSRGGRAAARTSRRRH